MSKVLGRLVGTLLAASTMLAVAGCDSPTGGMHGFKVSDANARGCEVLLTEGTAKIDKVVFDDSVVGTFVREAPRVAVTFVSAQGGAIGTGAVKLTVVGDAGQVQVKKVSCVGPKAEPLSGASVSLD